MRKKLLFTATTLALLLSNISYSQEEITEFLIFGQSNAAKLTKSYLEPLGHSIGNNMNSGWYNTGQAHRLGRFDFRFGIPITFIGEDHKSFTFNPDDYDNISLVDVNDAKVSTLFGSKKDGPEVMYGGQTFTLPPGTGNDYFPMIPFVMQLNVGLVKNTEVKLRLVPTMSVRDFSTRLYGFGIKHDIMQHIPVMENLPFDVSIIGSYSNLSSIYDLKYNPLNNPEIDTDEQELDISTSAYSISLVASKRLPFLSFYGGVRYMNSNTQFLMAGDYDLAAEIVAEPVDFKIKSSQFGLNAGTRLKLGFISFFVDGTYANYSSITGGVSMGFHN